MPGHKLPDIHFFISSIGGSGKSSIALMSADSINAKICDLYESREFLSVFESVDIFETNMAMTDDNSYKILDSAIDDIANYIEKYAKNTEEQGKPIVVDLGSSLTFSFMRYIENTSFIGAIDSYSKSKSKTYLHFIYSPEVSARSAEDVELFVKRKEFFQDKSIVLWINEYKETFLKEPERVALIESFKYKFGSKFLDVFHIPKNEAIKPLFRRSVYEPRQSIFKAYGEVGIFDKAKLRSYGNLVASFFERNEIEVRKLDLSAPSPKFQTTDVSAEVSNDTRSRKKDTTAEAESQRSASTSANDSAKPVQSIDASDASTPNQAVEFIGIDSIKQNEIDAFKKNVAPADSTKSISAGSEHNENSKYKGEVVDTYEGEKEEEESEEEVYEDEEEDPEEDIYGERYEEEEE